MPWDELASVLTELDFACINHDTQKVRKRLLSALLDFTPTNDSSGLLDEKDKTEAHKVLYTSHFKMRVLGA